MNIIKLLTLFFQIFFISFGIFFICVALFRLGKIIYKHIKMKSFKAVCVRYTDEIEETVAETTDGKQEMCKWNYYSTFKIPQEFLKEKENNFNNLYTIKTNCPIDVGKKVRLLYDEKNDKIMFDGNIVRNLLILLVGAVLIIFVLLLTI